METIRRNCGCSVRCVVGGDALCLSIAAASIVAKVVRDRAMASARGAVSGLRVGGNAGYATALHRDALRGWARHAITGEAFGTVPTAAGLTIAD